MDIDFTLCDDGRMPLQLDDKVLVFDSISTEIRPHMGLGRYLYWMADNSCLFTDICTANTTCTVLLRTLQSYMVHEVRHIDTWDYFANTLADVCTELYMELDIRSGTTGIWIHYTDTPNSKEYVRFRSHDTQASYTDRMITQQATSVVSCIGTDGTIIFLYDQGTTTPHTLRVFDFSTTALETTAPSSCELTFSSIAYTAHLHLSRGIRRYRGQAGPDTPWSGSSYYGCGPVHHHTTSGQPHRHDPPGSSAALCAGTTG